MSPAGGRLRASGLWLPACGVRPVVSGLWRLACGVRPVVSGLWWLACRVRPVVSGPERRLGGPGAARSVGGWGRGRGPAGEDERAWTTETAGLRIRKPGSAEPLGVGRRHRAPRRGRLPGPRARSARLLARARPAGRRAYVTSELVADIVALIDAAGAEKVHVVGHDWGAFVAWALASRHPERVHTLTAVSVPHPRAFTWAMPRGQALRSWYMAVFQVPVLPERFLPTDRGLSMLGGTGLSTEKMKAYVEPLGRDGLAAALNWYRAIPWSQREPGFGHRIERPDHVRVERWRRRARPRRRRSHRAIRGCSLPVRRPARPEPLDPGRGSGRSGRTDPGPRQRVARSASVRANVRRRGCAGSGCGWSAASGAPRPARSRRTRRRRRSARPSRAAPGRCPG